MALHNGKFIKTTDVVITGISGVFPQSDTIEELKQNLLSGKDMITDNDRWDAGDEGASRKMGIIKTLDRFDSSFFRIGRRQAEAMNISNRILMEKVFEAIVDAGYNPQQFKGTNTGVFAGFWLDEKDGAGDNAAELGEYAAFTYLRCLIANRISYWLDLRGPSFMLDTACSTGMYLLEMAYKAIQSGDCDAVIVCTVNLCVQPFATNTLRNMGVISLDGINRPFDADASGFVRGEAVVATVLQKKEDARRIYANVVHAKTNCDGYIADGVFYPSIDGQSDLFRRFYQEIDVDPTEVTHIEAHGTGTKVGDVIEVGAIEKIFCPRKRSVPLKIGSVKSNLGHTEASAALTSLAKVIIAFETGTIPPTLHFDTPHPKIEAFKNGNIEVLSQPTSYDGEYFAINSYGIGGANGHMLLSPNEKIKNDLDSVIQDIPLLVPASGRTEEAVNVILNDVEKNINNAEYVGLWHEIFNETIIGHGYRGYLISTNGNEFERHIKEVTVESKQIWFIFSGMGSQWPTMGKSLMRIPIFAESIHKSHKLLETKGIDLIRIITDNDPIIFKNILNSFVGIAAIQIALIDILRAVGIQPDGMIGHSVGELGCAYADSCLTSEQMLLAAYYRGLASLETEFIHGTMTAVGVGYDAIKDLIPPEIDVAAHNSATSSTISGPTDDVKRFMEELKQKDIFVREVNVSNIPYHSRYIAPAAAKLLSFMEKVIPAANLRSEKWICTSAPENEWSSNKVKYASAEYFTSNLLNPVYFEEALRHVPTDAVTIEIAPHGLLQAILKRSLPSTIDNIALTLKGTEDGTKFLINGLGRIYASGGSPKVSRLYPPVQFPVSRKTPMISPLIRWQHEKQWPLPKQVRITGSGERDVILYTKEHEYLRGHVIDGRNLYPATGYLYLVWETLAGLRDTKRENLSVVFENVRFERATNIGNTQKLIKFHISVQSGTGHFEVIENDATVVSGLVRVPEDINLEKINVLPFIEDISNADELPLTTKDFYKVLRLRGYHYKGLFKKVLCANKDGTYGRVSWCNNFISFMDTIAQIIILQKDINELIIPTFIRKIIIDVDEHKEILSTSDEENPEISVNYYPKHLLVSSGGIQMIDFKGSPIARKKDQASPVLEKYQFVPYITDQEMDLNIAVRLCVHIILENTAVINVKAVEMLGEDYNNEMTLISRLVADALGDLPMIQADVNVIKNDEVKPNDESQETAVPENLVGVKILEDGLPSDNSCLVIILTDITSKIDLLEKIFGALQNDGFLIVKEPVSSNVSFSKLGMSVCFSRMINAEERIMLLSKKAEMKSDAVSIKINNTSYSWISEIQQALTTLKPSDEKLIVYSEKEPLSGILGFFNCLRREEKGLSTRCFFLMDQDAPKFSLHRSIYKTQFEKNLSHNVYKNGQWGSYRHKPLEPVQDVEVDHAYLTQLVLGDFSTLRWVEGPLSPYKLLEEPVIQVHYSALNFKDLMVGAGRISLVYDRYIDGRIGFEFSGKDENGRRYAGMVENGGISNLVKSERALIWRVPDHMTLEEASTIATVYATVIYSFFFKMNLQKGCSVLIHAGSGGIGQAAINICLHYGCDIYTTVGTPQKVEYIRQKFPQIPENHIGNSRNTSFEKMIMDETEGKGVGVVLNSLAEDKLRASLRCVAKGGHFIDIGKYDMIKNNPIDLGPFLNAISFHSVQLDDKEAMKTRSTEEFQQKVQEMLNMGIIKPIDRTVFEIDQVENAIRYMAAGKHLGKVIIKIRNEDDDHATPSSIRFKAQPRVLCENTESVLIIGGLGGFGMELADWLIGRGAKKLILSSRNGVKNGYQSYKLKNWRSYGVDVVISTEDVTTEEGVQNLLQVANSIGPLRSIYNVAVVLQDDPFSQQNEEKFRISAGPKAIATLHLDKLSRRMCPYLKHFVVFSSVSCGRGNYEQTNYGMSNSIMERICETRRADNLPALAVQWGAIGEVGVVADLAEDNLTVVIGGTLQQKVKSCLETLNECMHQSNPIVSSMIVAEKRSSDTDIITHVANVLGIKDLKTISLTWTLPELGMDSITGAELKQVIEAEFGVFLTPQDMKNMTFAKLYAMKEEKSSKSGNKDTQMTQIQSLLSNELINIPLVRIPFNENKLNEEISARDHPTVFLFPGLEGIAKLAEPLAKNLTWQVLCFQYLSDDVPTSNPQEFLQYYTRLITDRLDIDQEFRIIGHSMGSVFALEVANILEKQGRKGYLWMIDASPAFLEGVRASKHVAKAVELDDESLQCYVCNLIITALLPQVVYDDMSKHLKQAKNWEGRKKLCCAILPKQLWGETLIHKMLDNMLRVFQQVSNYQLTAESLDTPCTLIKCLDNPYKLDEAYGLSKYFKQPVQVYEVEGVDHFSILGNVKTAEIIMKDFVEE